MLKRIALAATAVLCVAAATAEAQSSPPPPGRKISLPQFRMEAITVTLGPNGFEPAEVTRTGIRLLVVVHRKGLRRAFTTRLQANENGQLRDVTPAQRRGNDFMELLDLRPGTYVLSDSANPAKVCNIKVGQR